MALNSAQDSRIQHHSPPIDATDAPIFQQEFSLTSAPSTPASSPKDKDYVLSPSIHDDASSPPKRSYHQHKGYNNNSNSNSNPRQSYHDKSGEYFNEFNNDYSSYSNSSFKQNNNVSI